MSFSNPEVELETLPRFDAVEFRRPDPRYPAIVLGIVVAFELAALLAGCVILLLDPGARAALATGAGPLLVLVVLAMAALLAWYAYKSASVIRFAVREHDVILHKGVFFKRETIQPIRRIQHVEQVQGPVARRFGLARIRLFSAGTAHFAFEIPGLDAPTAARLRQSILSLRASQRADTRPAPGGGDHGGSSVPPDERPGPAGGADG